MPEVIIEGLHTDLHVPKCDPEAVLVTLRETHGERRVSIFIGRSEGESILRCLRGTTLSRPMTHDLLCSMIKQVGGTVERVVISELKNGVFYAVIPLAAGERVNSMDARASDAVAIAVRMGLPIVCEERVFEALDDTQELTPRGGTRLWPQ